jgi:hypothetical protein
MVNATEATTAMLSRMPLGSGSIKDKIWWALGDVCPEINRADSLSGDRPVRLLLRCGPKVVLCDLRSVGLPWASSLKHDG